MAKAVETSIGDVGHLLHFFPHMRYGFGADGSERLAAKYKLLRRNGAL